MLLDVRTAALNTEVEEHVQLATSRLMTRQMRTRVSPWNGTRCHLLAAAANEKYGHMALLLALRRGTPVIALGAPLEPLAATPLPANISTEALTQTLHERLEEIAPKTRKSGPGTDRRPLICRLSAPSLRGKAVNISNSERKLMQLRPQAGRAYAPSAIDFATSIRGFQDLAWGRVEVDNSPIGATMVSRSIESFLLLSTNHGKLALPDFPEGYYQLKAWPDLGSLPDMVSALHIAKQLVTAPTAPAELVNDDQFNIGRDDVNACLWAWTAADLLQEKEAGSRPQKSRLGFRRRRVTGKVWSSIARRFGLLNK